MAIIRSIAKKGKEPSSPILERMMNATLKHYLKLKEKRLAEYKKATSTTPTKDSTGKAWEIY